MNIEEQAKKVAIAKRSLAQISTKVKDEALHAIADSIWKMREKILAANAIDVKYARKRKMKESLVDRLMLTDSRIDGMIHSIEDLIALRDPVGNADASWTMPNGLRISKVRVPIGAIGIIYEGRPNVTVETSTIALKSGNSILLRGSSSAQNTNEVLVRAIKEGIEKTDVPEDAVELVEDTSHEAVGKMIRLKSLLDLIIPRGGKQLIDFVTKNSTVPVLETGIGNCHIFVDATADLGMALDIIDNAKTQRPGTCNAVEKILIHKKICESFLPSLYKRLSEKGVEFRGCEVARQIIPEIKPATEEDWATEYLDLILGVKCVQDIDEAIEHITKYGTKHSEAIVTNDYSNAMKFTSAIDASAVYVNASTRFTDGGQFGFGAEMGISTQRLHARGPVGLFELTTYKYVILGEGQIRK